MLQTFNIMLEKDTKVADSEEETEKDAQARGSLTQESRSIDGRHSGFS